MKNQTKNLPVVYHDDEWIFALSNEEVEFIFAQRSNLCTDDRRLFRPELLAQKNWIVAPLPEIYVDETEDSIEEFKLKSRIQRWAALTPNGFLLGCSNAEKFLPEIHPYNDETDFLPPLAAKTLIDIKGYSAISGSHIQLYASGYFITDSACKAAELRVMGEYSLLAGPRDFIERCLGKSIQASWETLKSPMTYADESRALLTKYWNEIRDLTV